MKKTRKNFVDVGDGRLRGAAYIGLGEVDIEFDPSARDSEFVPSRTQVIVKNSAMRTLTHELTHAWLYLQACHFKTPGQYIYTMPGEQIAMMAADVAEAAQAVSAAIKAALEQVRAGRANAKISHRPRHG